MNLYESLITESNATVTSRNVDDLLATFVIDDKVSIMVSTRDVAQNVSKVGKSSFSMQSKQGWKISFDWIDSNKTYKIYIADKKTVVSSVATLTKEMVNDLLSDAY